jgi:hypothetical protein
MGTGHARMSVEVLHLYRLNMRLARSGINSFHGTGEIFVGEPGRGEAQDLKDSSHQISSISLLYLLFHTLIFLLL